MIDLGQARSVAERLASQAGEFLLQERERVKILDYKDRQDIVTSADLEVEKLIIDGLQQEFSSHNILSEEAGEVGDGDEEYCWIIDPLDGTKEYIRGLPGVAVTLALEHQGGLVLGVVNVIVEGQFFSAAQGLGVTLNGHQIRLSDKAHLRDSFVYCKLPTHKLASGEFSQVWERLGKVAQSSYRLRSHPSLNICCGWVAMGGYEAYVQLPEEKWWDVAPGIAIAQEAGAKVTDVFGKPIVNRDTSKGIIVSNGLIHNQLLSLLH
jgi:myo-inositol-1(or 4)-monophosphatase